MKSLGRHVAIAWLFVCATMPSHGSIARFESSDTGVLTQEIQAMLDSGVDTLVFPLRDADYLTGPLRINRDNFVWILEAGAVLRAAPGEFPRLGHSLITVAGRRNVTLAGTEGARLVMGGREYTDGEWRHAVRLLGVRNFRLSGLIIDSSGGDGVYVGAHWRQGIAASEDVILENIRLHGHRRQGISVISARRLLVRGAVISGTSGTGPAAGIDFEPNRPDEVLEHCVVRASRIEDNDSHGALVWLGKFDASSAPVSILFEDVTFSRSRRGAGMRISGFAKSGHKGRIEVRRAHILDNHRAGLLIEGLQPGGLRVLVDSSWIRQTELPATEGHTVYAAIGFGTGKSGQKVLGGLEVVASIFDLNKGGRLLKVAPGPPPSAFQNVKVEAHVTGGVREVPQGVRFRELKIRPLIHQVLRADPPR